MSLASSTIVQGATCPIMVSSAATGNGFATSIAAVSTTLQVAWGGMGNDITTSGAGTFYPYSTTRMYIPFYDLQPDKAFEIVRSTKKKSIFLDYYTQQFKNNAVSGNFALQVSASLKNAKYVPLLPYSNTVSGHFVTASGVDQYGSPFDSAPWTCQPGSAITNFNVQVGNKLVFNAGSSYDFSGFLDEFVKLARSMVQCLTSSGMD